MKLTFRLLLLSVGLFCLPIVAQAGEVPFTDVTGGGHFEAINSVKEWGIFDGYADGSFDGTKEMNRAELSKILVLGSGILEEDVEACSSETEHDFSDVAEGEWYTGYVYCAKTKGWVAGDDGASTFRPGDPVLLAEAFKMLLESQHGTPDDAYAGTQWYELYLNALEQNNMLYVSDSGYLYYTFSSGDLGIGFDNVIDSKVQRHDIAEFYYRIRLSLEAGDGELTVYNPLISIDEYEDTYGAIVEESSDGVLSIADPHFNFQLENVYIGDIDLDDLFVYIENPSGSENGYRSEWKLMYPTLRSYYDDEGLEHAELFYLDVQDEDYTYSSGTSAVCMSLYSYMFDLWSIHETMCGEQGADSDDIEALLQLSEYGETYDGEVIALSPIAESDLSILNFNHVFLTGSSQVYWFEDGDGDFVDYLYTLTDLTSEDDDQTEDYQDWLEEFIGYMESADYTSALASLEELDEMIVDYEKQVIAGFGDTLVVDVVLAGATSYHQVDWIIYRGSVSNSYLVEGDFGDYGWGSFSLYFSEENDPWDGEYFGTDISFTENLVVTVSNEPILSDDFDVESDEYMHLVQFAQGYYENMYYYEIIDVSVD
jgi:hypothetical protein